MFRNCETETSTESLDTLPFYPLAFSLPENIWNTAQKGSSTKCYGTVRQNKFDGKSLQLRPFILDNFPYQNFSKTQKVSLTKVLGNVRQKFFDARNWYPPLIHKLFRQRNFSGTQHRRVPLRNVTLLSDKTFSTENRDTGTSLILYMFRYQTIFRNPEGFLYEMFWYCDTNKFRRKLLIHAPSFP